MTRSKTTQKPHVTSVEPTAGKAGDVIHVFGKNLGKVKSVKFQDTLGLQRSSVAKVMSDDEIQTTVPDGLNPGSAKLTLVASDGASQPFGFTILPGA